MSYQEYNFSEETGILKAHARDAQNQIGLTKYYCSNAVSISNEGGPGVIDISGNAHHSIYADMITINGKINQSGGKLFLFCRLLVWKSDRNGEAAEICLKGRAAPAAGVGQDGQDGARGGSLEVYCQTARPVGDDGKPLIIDISGGDAANGGSTELGRKVSLGGSPGLPGTCRVCAINARPEDFFRISYIGRFGSPWNGKPIEAEWKSVGPVWPKNDLAWIAKNLSLTQCELALSQARVDLFSAESGEDDQKLLLATAKIMWLYDILSVYPENLRDNFRYQALQSATIAQMNNLASHKDYFGNPYTWVPMASKEFLIEEYDSAAKFYKEAIDLKSKLNNCLNDSLERRTHYESVIHKAKAIISGGEKKLDALITRIAEQNKELDHLSSAADKARKKLSDALEHFSEDAKKPNIGPSGITLEDITDVMQMLSFMPHGPAKGDQAAGVLEGVAGGAGAAAAASNPMMLAAQGLNASSQLIKLGNKAINYTQTDSGQSVKRDYIVTQAINLKRGIDVLEEIPRLKSDHLLEMSDKNSVKLLASKEQIESLCNNFRNGFHAEVAQIDKSLDDFMNITQQMNAKVLEYNSLVSNIIETHSQVVSCRNQINEMESEKEKEKDPGVEMLTAFVNSLAERAKDNCLRQLYYANRALMFSWLKKPEGLLSFKNPSAITSIEIDEKRQDLKSALETEIMEEVLPPVHFPSIAKRDVYRGVFVEIAEDEYEDELNELREKGVTDILIPPVFKDTTQNESQFASMSDVRLAKVRVWFIFDDESVLGNKRVTIQHLGVDDIVSRNDERSTYTHDVVSVNFEYRYDGGANALEKIIHGDLKNAEIDEIYNDISKGIGKIDGDIHHMDDELSKQYALVGPFALWRVDCHEWKPEKLKKLYFEFHGVHYPFR